MDAAAEPISLQLENLEAVGSLGLGCRDQQREVQNQVIVEHSKGELFLVKKEQLCGDSSVHSLALASL